MISVIIPVKNGASTIEASIRSVLRQNVEDIEILCIINGTNDNTEEVIKFIDDPRIKILHSAPGIVAALNEGLRNSKGEFIARQDADDVWLPEKLKKQLDFFAQHPEVDVLGTQLNVVDVDGNLIRKTNYPTLHDDMVKSLFSGNNPIGHPSVVFRRRILDKCAGYFDLFHLAEDFDLWIRSIPWYKLANLNEELVVYKHVPNPTYQPQVPQILSSWYRIIYGVK